MVTAVDAKKVTRQEMIEYITKKVTENPDLRNPRNDYSDSCMYFLENPKPGESHRCIVGQMVFDMGWEMHDWGIVEGASEIGCVNEWPITKDDLEWLGRVQIVFDGINIYGEIHDKQRTWGKALEICQKNDWLGIEEAN